LANFEGNTLKNLFFSFFLLTNLVKILSVDFKGFFRA